MSSLSDVFALDPNKCNRTHVDEIVAEFRRKRAQFNLGDLQAGSTKPLKPATVENLKAASKVNIGDL